MLLDEVGNEDADAQEEQNWRGNFFADTVIQQAKIDCERTEIQNPHQYVFSF